MDRKSLQRSMTSSSRASFTGPNNCAKASLQAEWTHPVCIRPSCVRQARTRGLLYLPSKQHRVCTYRRSSVCMSTQSGCHICPFRSTGHAKGRSGYHVAVPKGASQLEEVITLQYTTSDHLYGLRPITLVISAAPRAAALQFLVSEAKFLGLSRKVTTAAVYRW